MKLKQKSVSASVSKSVPVKNKSTPNKLHFPVHAGEVQSQTLTAERQRRWNLAESLRT